MRVLERVMNELLENNTYSEYTCKGAYEGCHLQFWFFNDEMVDVVLCDENYKPLDDIIMNIADLKYVYRKPYDLLQKFYMC